MKVALGVVVVALLLYAAVRFLFWGIKTTLKMAAIGLSVLLLFTAGAVIWWVWF